MKLHKQDRISRATRCLMAGVKLKSRIQIREEFGVKGITEFRFERNISQPVSNIELVIVGHTPQPVIPARLGNVVNIDGGVYKADGELGVFEIN